MLKAKMIPKVVVEAAVSTWLNSDGTVRQDITETIAAAINAWPGMRVKAVLLADTVLLPLPQEPTND